MRSYLAVILAGLVLVMVVPVVAAQQPAPLADLDEAPILRIAAGEDPAIFGTELETATISAFAFRPDDSTDIFQYYSNGFMRSDYNVNVKVSLGVGFEIPVGAKVWIVCTHIYDGDPDGEVSLTLARFEQPTDASGTAFTELLSDWTGSGYSWDDGYSHVCVEPSSPQVTTYADIDGDGTEGHVSYVLAAALLGLNHADLRIGTVAIAWSRLVSPAPAVATFNDVPVGAFGFRHIEALAASGITAGCGNDNFCPNATLTRDQMAVFLAKALGLHYTQ